MKRTRIADKSSRGLGDSIEKFTTKTGIKKKLSIRLLKLRDLTADVTKKGYPFK